MSAPCTHLENVSSGPMPEGGCEECLKIGDSWVHLRFCISCERTLCCNDSKNQHARKHWEASSHGVIRSKEPGDNWAYCYPDDQMIFTSGP